MKIVCLGDSFTRGFGVSEADCWASRLPALLDEEVVNKGINGDTTGGMLARFHQDVVLENPRYVLIDGGFNDFLAGAPVGTVQANFMALVHQAYHNNIIPILMLIPGGNSFQFRQNWPDFIDIEQVRREYMDFRMWMKHFCQGFSVFHIDCFQMAENDDFKYHRYLDGIHMDREGHKMVAELIANYFKETVR